MKMHIYKLSLFLIYFFSRFFMPHDRVLKSLKSNISECGHLALPQASAVYRVEWAALNQINVNKRFIQPFFFDNSRQI